MASLSCGVKMEVCRKFVGSFSIGTKVSGSSGDKNGLEDEESGSLSAGYKIFDNFKIKSSLGCWSLVIITTFQRTKISSFDPKNCRNYKA